MKNKLTAEQWKARKEIVSTDHYGEVRGIAPKSKLSASGKKLVVPFRPRHIAHRKATRDGTTNHYRVQQGRGNTEYADINVPK